MRKTLNSESEKGVVTRPLFFIRAPRPSYAVFSEFDFLLLLEARLGAGVVDSLTIARYFFILGIPQLLAHGAVSPWLNHDWSSGWPHRVQWPGELQCEEIKFFSERK